MSDLISSQPNAHHPMRKIFHRTHDPIWHLQIGVLIIIILQLVTSNTFLPFNKVWLVIPELILALTLILVTNDGYSGFSRVRRNLALTLVVIIAAINIFSLILLIDALLFGHSVINGHSLLINGFVIYVTNVFMFALWYWEMDGGGPDRRTEGQRQRDFIFPQMIHRTYAGEDWLPGFTDYLYLSTTNVTNFASADTQPITHRAKLMMMVQALVAVVTVVLVLAHAINTLQ